MANSPLASTSVRVSVALSRHTASLAGVKSSAMFQAQAMTSRRPPCALLMRIEAPVLSRR